MTLSELLLKPVQANDLPSVVELDRLCLGGLWTLAGYQRELDSPNSELLTIARSPTVAGSSAVKPLLALGCFWAILEEAHITILAVAPEYQNQGLGTMLLYTLLQKAAQRGLERATLEVRASNAKALALYQKFGFQIAGRRKGYYQDSQEDALILWLGGLQSSALAQTLRQWQQQSEAKLLQHHWRVQAVFPSMPSLTGD